MQVSSVRGTSCLRLTDCLQTRAQTLCGLAAASKEAYLHRRGCRFVPNDQFKYIHLPVAPHIFHRYSPLRPLCGQDAVFLMLLAQIFWPFRPLAVWIGPVGLYTWTVAQDYFLFYFTESQARLSDPHFHQLICFADEFFE